MNCGGAEIVDDVLSPVIYSLYRNPLGFRETDVRGVRLAKTKLRINGPDLVMSHTLWFRADETTRVVELLYVEVSSPNNMSWDDNGEIPF